jgi:hypothetical protein
VESSCVLGNEPLVSIKCWELPSGCTSCGLSSGTQLHRVSLLYDIILRRRWIDNIKLDVLEIGLNVVDRIGLAQDRYRWRALVNSVMNLWVP